MTARVLVKTQRRRWRVVGKGEEKPPPLRRQFSIHPRRRKACRRRERLTNNRGINYPGCWLRLSPRLPAPERTPQGVEQPHSGRETELRDVLAIAEEIDLDAVTPHLRRGDDDALWEQLERGLEILESDELKHGFRSDFGASAVSTETVTALQEYLSAQVDELD